MVAMLQEERHANGPVLIQVEIDARRIECVRCKAELLEAVYWRDTITGWRLLAICAYCRNRTVLADQKRQAEASLIKLYDLASDPVEGRRGYIQDGQLRCSVCRSTAYKEVSLIRQSGTQSMYVIETLCWMAGHTLQARWFQGSPIKSKFPTSDTAPTLLGPLKTAKVVISEEPPKTLARFLPKMLPPAPPIPFRYRGVIPLSMRGVVHDFEPETDGCDERCETFRYIDPNDLNGPMHVTTKHSPEAHNLHGASSRDGGKQIFEWPGLKLDFVTMTAYVDGDPVSPPLTVKEWQLIRMLAMNNGAVVKQTALLSSCWGPQYVEQGGYHLLRVHMARLRPKLAKDNDPNKFIVTKPGLGYMMRRALTT